MAKIIIKDMNNNHIHNLGENYDEYFGLDEYDAYDPFGEEPEDKPWED